MTYETFSEVLIYESDPCRDRVYTIPHRTFLSNCDISDEATMEKVKARFERLGNADVRIYKCKAINMANPTDIWTYYHFEVKKYSNPVEVKKNFRLVKQLHGEDVAIRWFKDRYNSGALKQIGVIECNSH